MGGVGETAFVAPDTTEPTRRRHPVIGFTVRRVAQGLLVLVAASFVIFFATNALPGNVAQTVLGRNGNPRAVHQLEARLGLNRPFFERYVDWLGSAAHGDFGRSAVAEAESAQTTSISALIGTPMRNSAILAVLAMVIIVPVSLLFGVLAGIAAGRPRDFVISYSALLLGAFPEFVLGTALVTILFAELNLLPPVTLVPPGSTPFANPDALIMPVLTLVGVSVGFSARQVRAGMVEIVRTDYVVMGRLNGLPERQVLTRYALRNALVPAVQTFAQTAQYLIGGIIIVEAVFAYPGIGTYLVNAVSSRDLPAVGAVAVILAAIYIAINVIADLVVVFLVPKLRTGLSG
jgi:peptide/nickel transport system permease protein